ncbi:hypothetical protein HFP89_09845 [Wenzhouxiangella sp. XN79A]|uniref:protein YgfX n=1 Tax=Wenzhouxiangella sp. XN79A TaxID=2724193 RepID=UPI00144AAB1C|nr:protein YgfX [Wenzhouxiangella sp. XN79A]NKI35467.1 hypothetical protein [Wenzhouxiangella sp. XN79A]
MAGPSARAWLVTLVGALAVLAAVTAPISPWAALPATLFVVAVVVHALLGSPGRHHVERIEGGRIRLRTPSGQCLQGALQPAYCSGFYCAFTVHDPVAGSSRFGLFRDELDPDGWRRLRVALRSGGGG